VVTGISLAIIYGDKVSAALGLQWGPVVVTGISGLWHHGAGTYDGTLQWGPVVVTGISGSWRSSPDWGSCFNGVRSW